MKTITSQASLKPILSQIEALMHSGDAEAQAKVWTLLENEVLVHKVKFPVLEYLALQLKPWYKGEALNSLLDQLAQARHISCYPVIGKLLQLQLSENLAATYDLAINHIIEGNEWYCCDIISERVFGEGTLLHFEESLALLENMGQHENIWIQRSIGIATHYATKKKLARDQVAQLFQLMLRHGHKTQYFIKKGIGWGAKTIARNHPDLIQEQAEFIRATPLSGWFKTKLNIGLRLAKQPILEL